MSYIRTKNGVYEVESTFLNNNGKWIGYNIVGNDMVILREQVISQADTIKELCDEFVYEYKNPFYKNSKPTYELVEMSLEAMKTTMEYFNSATFYGAIWVVDDNGVPILKPVAKMNDKGDLELI